MSMIINSFLLLQTFYSIVYQASIESHRKFEISDDLMTKFCQQFDLFTAVRLLNTFKSQDHTRAMSLA